MNLIFRLYKLLKNNSLFLRITDVKHRHDGVLRQHSAVNGEV